MKKALSIIMVTMLAVVACFSSGCFDFFKSAEQHNDTIAQTQSVAINANSGTRTEMSYSEVYASVKNSVVALVTQKQGATVSASSGVVIDLTRRDSEGQIIESANEVFVVTCLHCIEDIDTLIVYFVDANGKNFDDDSYDTNYSFTGTIGGNPSTAGAVRLIGGDVESDLALVRVSVNDATVKSKITAAKIMDTNAYQLKVGDEVLAIGNPKGTLPGTMTKGMISYLGRKDQVEDIGVLEMIQIDANTNTGNSGGALFNLYGELIGITNAGYGFNTSTATDYDGLNFAIPLVTSIQSGVMDIIPELARTATDSNYGYIEGKIRLGVTVSQVNGGGMQVIAIESSGAAYKAGIRLYDIITEVDGSTITDAASFDAACKRVQSKGVGKTYSVSVKTPTGTGYFVTYEPNSYTVTNTQYIYKDTGR